MLPPLIRSSVQLLKWASRRAPVLLPPPLTANRECAGDQNGYGCLRLRLGDHVIDVQNINSCEKFQQRKKTSNAKCHGDAAPFSTLPLAIRHEGGQLTRNTPIGCVDGMPTPGLCSELMIQYSRFQQCPASMDEYHDAMPACRRIEIYRSLLGESAIDEPPILQMPVWVHGNPFNTMAVPI